MEWKMPDLGEGVQEGEILKWLVKEGEKVSIDQHLVEIMTDKATMEIPSSISGTVQKIVMKEGSVAKIGQTLAVIGEGAAAPAKEAPSAAPATAPAKIPAPPPAPTPAGAAVQPAPASGAAVLAAPAVRQLARELGIDLNKVRGRGPGGRILAEDVQEAKKNIRIPPGEEVRMPLRGLRRKIAEHMSLSRKTAAHFHHIDEADLTELVALREKSKKEAEAKRVKLSFLPYFIKAVAMGLKKFPQINASLDEEAHEIILKKYYNIGVAVATDSGLIVPVVKNADRLSLLDLAKETARLGEAARAGKLALDDLKNSTFTITNIGSIGGILSAPIINTPEAAIMGLHQIKPRPMVIEEAVAIRQMMYIAISADHRIVDGADVARFLKEVIQILEHPAEVFRNEKI